MFDVDIEVLAHRNFIVAGDLMSLAGMLLDRLQAFRDRQCTYPKDMLPFWLDGRCS